MPSKPLRCWGQSACVSIIGHAAFNGEGYDSKSEAILLLEGKRTGLIKLLELNNQPVKPASSVGANNLFYARLSADATEVYRQLEQMIRLVDGQAADGAPGRIHDRAGGRRDSEFADGVIRTPEARRWLSCWRWSSPMEHNQRGLKSRWHINNGRRFDVSWRSWSVCFRECC